MDIENNNHNSIIYRIFLDTQSKYYLKNTSNVRKVIDYIAGMTDDYFNAQYEKYIGKIVVK